MVRNVLVAVILIGSIGIAFQALASSIAPRFAVESTSEQSWYTRLSSISVGLSYLISSIQTLAFGVGPGLSPPLLQHSVNTSALAVYSVAITYIVETGILGIGVICGIGAFLIGRIANSSQRLLGLICLIGWVSGVAVTNAYFPLSPIWIFLGLLLVWDRLWPPIQVVSEVAIGGQWSSAEALALRSWRRDTRDLKT
jgi:hypothetical protein